MNGVLYWMKGLRKKQREALLKKDNPQSLNKEKRDGKEKK